MYFQHRNHLLNHVSMEQSYESDLPGTYETISIPLFSTLKLQTTNREPMSRQERPATQSVYDFIQQHYGYDKIVSCHTTKTTFRRIYLVVAQPMPVCLGCSWRRRDSVLECRTRYSAFRSANVPLSHLSLHTYTSQDISALNLNEDRLSSGYRTLITSSNPALTTMPQNRFSSIYRIEKTAFGQLMTTPTPSKHRVV